MTTDCEPIDPAFPLVLDLFGKIPWTSEECAQWERPMPPDWLPHDSQTGNCPADLSPDAIRQWFKRNIDGLDGAEYQFPPSGIDQQDSGFGGPIVRDAYRLLELLWPEGRPGRPYRPDGKFGLANTAEELRRVRDALANLFQATDDKTRRKRSTESGMVRPVLERCVMLDATDRNRLNGELDRLLRMLHSDESYEAVAAFARQICESMADIDPGIDAYGDRDHKLLSFDWEDSWRSFQSVAGALFGNIHSNALHRKLYEKLYFAFNAIVQFVMDGTDPELQKVYRELTLESLQLYLSGEGYALPPEGQRDDGDPPKVSQPPSGDAIKCYRAHFFSEMNQTELAERMTKELGRPISQGQVSRWISQVEKWISAGNLLPDLPNTKKANPTTMDPQTLELGARQDGHTPRQRARRSEDSDD